MADMEQKSAPEADNTAGQQYQRMLDAERRLEREQQVLKKLTLFKDVKTTHKGVEYVRRKRQQKYNDSPRIQMMLKRRDRMERCEAQVELLIKELDVCTDPKDRLHLLTALTKLELLVASHGLAIEKTIGEMGAGELKLRDGRQKQVIAFANMHQRAQLAQAKSGNPDQASDAELLEVTQHEGEVSAEVVENGTGEADPSAPQGDRPYRNVPSWADPSQVLP